MEERKLQPKQQQLIVLASEGFVYIFEDDVKADPCPNPLEVIELEEEEKIEFSPSHSNTVGY